MNKILNRFQQLLRCKGHVSIEIQKFLRKAKNRTFKFHYSKQQKRISIKCLNIMSSKNVKNISRSWTQEETDFFAEILSDPESLEKLALKKAFEQRSFYAYPTGVYERFKIGFV